MFKKMLCVLFALLLVFSAACSSQNHDVGKENPGDGSSATSGEQNGQSDTSSATENITSQKTQFRTMTFNIRNGEFTDARIDLVLHMINTYSPDTFGVQEATVEWMQVLKSYLGDKYECVGVGRNADGTGEASAVFYLKSKFELLDGGTKWLSETPDVPGSKIESSEYIRIFSYVKLKIKETGKIFVHVNTHLDNSTDKVRSKQATYILNFLEQYKTEGIPLVLTGDFNCSSTSNCYSRITINGLQDSLSVAKEAESGPTYHAYGKLGLVIDYIFVSNGTEVSKFKVCNETFENEDGTVAYPSDHNPVIIDYLV